MSLWFQLKIFRRGLHFSGIPVLNIFLSSITVYWGKTYSITVFHYKPFKLPFLVMVFDRNFDGVTVSETPSNTQPSWYLNQSYNHLFESILSTYWNYILVYFYLPFHSNSQSWYYLSWMCYHRNRFDLLDCILHCRNTHL